MCLDLTWKCSVRCGCGCGTIPYARERLAAAVQAVDRSGKESIMACEHADAVAVMTRTYDVSRDDTDIDGLLYLEKHLPDYMANDLEGSDAKAITVDILVCPECKAVFGDYVNAEGKG